MARSTLSYVAIKTCQRCGLDKPIGEFHKDKNQKDGHANWCKGCVAEYGKEYHKRPDVKKRIAKSKHEYQIKNKDRLAAKKREYYLANKEIISERGKIYSQSPSAKKKRRAYCKRNKERIAERHKEYILVKNYGITIEERNKIIDEQNGRCAICGNELDMATNTHVDHDHDTGMVRGILCYHCNMAIGLLMDDPDIAKKATEYLTKYKEVQNG